MATSGIGVVGGIVAEVPLNDLLFSPISVSSSGSTTVVSAVSGCTINVCSYVFVAGVNVSVKWRSNSTDLTGAMPIIANGGVDAPVSSPGLGPLFKTASGEPLVLDLSTAGLVAGHMSYFLEKA